MTILSLAAATVKAQPPVAWAVGPSESIPWFLKGRSPQPAQQWPLPSVATLTKRALLFLYLYLMISLPASPWIAPPKALSEGVATDRTAEVSSR